MFKTKSFLTLAVGLLALFSLLAAACGSSGGDNDAASSATAATAARTEPEPTNGFDGETIKLGFLTALSGTLALIGAPIAAGAQVYWDWVNNELGGIDGQYKVELVIEDTADDPATAVQAYQKIKNDVALFGEILSTPVTAAVLEQLKVDNILGVPGSLAGEWASERLLIPTAAAYEYEMINLVDWWHNQQSDGNDTYCAIFVDDKYGQDTMRGTRFAIDRLGLELAVETTINRGDTSFVAQLTEMRDAGCTVVFAVTVPSEQNAMLGEAQEMGFTPTWLGALPSHLNLFSCPLADRYTKFFVTQDAPPIANTTVEGVANFVERFAEYGDAEVSSFHLTGYVLSFAVHAILEKAAELNDFSREGLLEAYSLIGEVDTEGLTAGNYVYGEVGDRVPISATRILRHDPSVPGDCLNQVALFDSDLNAEFDL